MSRLIEDLEPETKSMAIAHQLSCAAQGIFIVFTQTYRTPQEQQAIYDQGRRTPGPVVSHAPPGYSWHEFRRAYDVAIKSWAGDKTPGNWYDGPWELVGQLGEKEGLEWGGRWKHPDIPHFQHTQGKTLAQMRLLRDQGNFA